jgi:hypothetical protein
MSEIIGAVTYLLVGVMWYFVGRGSLHPPFVILRQQSGPALHGRPSGGTSCQPENGVEHG